MRVFEDIYPELELFDNDAEAEAALERARKDHVPWVWRAAVVFAVIILYATRGPALHQIDLANRWAFHCALPGWAYHALKIVWVWALAAILGSAGYYLFRRTIGRSLRHMLQEKGIPICVACGYDCRGLTEPRCPECGREFDPKLLTPASKQINHHST